MKAKSVMAVAPLALSLVLSGCSKREADSIEGAASADASTTNATVKEQSLPPVKVRVLLEIDHMEGTKPVEIMQTVNGQRVSLVDIYRRAGVELRVAQGTKKISWQDTIRLADLHSLMTSASTVAPQPGELKVQMVVVSEDRDSPTTYGIMFDFGANDINDIPRQGFAVFESAHKSLAGGVIPEVLLTTAHELSHVFNLHHSDWSGERFDHASTIEGYSYTDSVKWQLSEASIQHLKGPSCPTALVMPGAGGLPFGLITARHADLHQVIPADSYEIVATNLGTAHRGATVSHAMAVRAQLAAASGRDISAESPLRLALAAPKEEYVVGEAVTLTAALHNAGTSPAEVTALLNPEFRMLSIAVQAPGDTAMRPYFPPVIRDTRGSAKRTLAAGESIVAEAKVFFGSGGWTFETPGEYVVQATFPKDGVSSNEFIRSEPLRLTVRAPETPADTRARALLSREGARLGNQQGLYLYMRGGGSTLKEAEANLRQIIQDAPTAKQAVDARIAVANNILAPVGRPSTPTAAQLETARRLIQGAQAASVVAPTALLGVQTELASQLDKAGMEVAAEAERAIVKRELLEQNKVRALDRRALERRL